MEIKAKYPGPWIDINQDNRLVLKVCEWRHQIPLVNQSKCSYCGTCYLFCPTGCIKPSDTHFDADLAFCKGCGLCAKICHANAIKMVTEENE